MTKEEKAKRYDIALDKIKRLLGTGSNCSREELEYVFPELRELEDEKMRKDIITYLKSAIANKGYRDKIIESWIDWLEKQGEKGTKGNDREIPFDTWSEEDDEHLERILKELESQRQRPFNRPYLDKIESDIAWLKSLKNRYTWKPSEGQLECLGYAIEKAEKDYPPLTNNRIYLTLKELKKQLEKL
jgi:hypothetical protein